MSENWAVWKSDNQEIKKNLQGINSGMEEAENQINNLAHKEEKEIQSEQQEEKSCFVPVNFFLFHLL